jgi:hypothetical protein
MIKKILIITILLLLSGCTSYNVVNRSVNSDFVKFKELAEQGDPEAQFALGVMYDNGLGVPKDYQKAVYWLSLIHI